MASGSRTTICRQLAQAAYSLLRTERPRRSLLPSYLVASQADARADANAAICLAAASPCRVSPRRDYSAAAVKPIEPESLRTSHSKRRAPRNTVGVQLLSPSLHSQLFPPGSCSHLPGVDPLALSIAQEHLSSHGLQPSQASVLPEVSFQLPPLRHEERPRQPLRLPSLPSGQKDTRGIDQKCQPTGPNLAEHFWIIGREAAQPWLGMAHLLAKQDMPPKPEGVCANYRTRGTSADEGEAEVGFAAEDWLALESSIRNIHDLRPPQWVRRAGWTRYPLLRSADRDPATALGVGEPIPFPPAEDGPMVFDVETMPRCSHFAVMATAVSEKAWYSWLSPWLLGESNEMDHLIPFGAGRGTTARLIVGHNVGYDRARVLDEYSLERSSIRWLDTMSLHVATRGISSPQRPAWMQHANARKMRETEKKLERLEVENAAREEIKRILGGEGVVDDDALSGMDAAQLVEEYFREQREAMREAVADVLNSLNANQQRSHAESTSEGPPVEADGTINGNGDDAASASLWQDVTSKNSLADVAELHCGITLSKDSRNIFVESENREEVLEHLDELLEYCATDVDVTHKVFKNVWPFFVEENCRHPVTMAGVFELGSTFLPVDQEWNKYIEHSEQCFRQASDAVRDSLVSLAESVREQGCKDLSWEKAEAIAERRQRAEDQVAAYMEFRDVEPFPYQHHSQIQPETQAWWERDPWLSQLDWSPKKPKKTKASAVAGKSAELGEPLVADPGHRIVPTWYRDMVFKAPPSGISLRSPIALSLVRLSYEGQPLIRDDQGRWMTEAHGVLNELGNVQNPLTSTFLKTKFGKSFASLAQSLGNAAVEALRAKDQEATKGAIHELAEQALAERSNIPAHLQHLDWSPVQVRDPENTEEAVEDQSWWPKWYWDLFKSATGQLELTIRSKVAPTLLNVSWRGRPLFHSREHGWVYRVDPEISQDNDFTTRQKPVEFTQKADAALKLLTGPQEHVINSRGRETNELVSDPTRPTFFKVPHSAGDEANVGSPFAKSFITFFEDGTLRSEHPSEEGRLASKAALDMNAQCSYWISARDRVKRQMVVWDGQCRVAMGAKDETSSVQLGMILPQVIQMGTVTRRAIEKTWLTASNAKKNRVGSELKSMVKAPLGWSIVGADVDSEELWICSVMGDAQFGVHGATAVGWMTLEGTKAQGTDLHSKTASILGTSRNQAKVFNYSRIYGAGIRHATQLMLKANPSMPIEEAMRLSKQLYTATKGQNTHSTDYFGSKFWYGGSESYVFNKLESIAISDRPRTPALDCGVTAALSRKFLPKRRWMDGKVGEDYMPSRINWVVQSSGVDYLHMLTAAMSHLCTTYGIDARFMLSVHDEVRYLCKEEDRYRTALALQIANLWTRAMFAYRLNFDDLPQGCAFFSQVDIDRILRKEVDDACVTPSHPDPVPPGEALTIEELLEKTDNGNLSRAKPTSASLSCPPYSADPIMRPVFPPFEWTHQTHRSSGQGGLLFLQAQATSDINEIRSLDRRAQALVSSNTRRSVQTNTKAQRPFLSRRPFHVSKTFSAGSAARAYSTSCRSQPSTTQLMPTFPRPPAQSPQPFFRTLRHRSTVFSLYRSLLKACSSDHPMLRQWICRTTRHNRQQTGPGRTAAQIREGQRLLYLFLRAKEGSASAQAEVLSIEDKLRIEKHKRDWEAVYAVLDEPARRPRLSGALLKPTLFNPPLPRFKPVQPDAITMMIFKRRKRRLIRRQYQVNNAELIASVQAERVLYRSFRTARRAGNATSDWEDTSSWLGPLNQDQKILAATFAADVKRSQMVFPERMLRQAKQVRRNKHCALLRKAEARKRERDRVMDLG
ncbi:hypothetical protein K437DRAFT_271157 [Tilletiaria anomala UBC 951]|uniref:Mitochondrial DNA polymerase catalytic subunit n=1 Tax=Tilletiaria anomala (strain ATCC 24038 / CBS 436.72 / UBC 951) TaxID=1037660 RepID=A0A066VC69_TILAU|nr:uncharacterized protein K437DRAFT_271157 [Tilletiaria anomala UBC 951]KDN36329.1 hypothetical protein K437DRAFT_271157 [Tilletiaria anomala UBC 951]